MVSLTIDGRAVSVPKGATILDAARQLGIHIPTLCWLEKVSPTGACRVCVVEVEGVARPMTACNTPVKEGIVVTTQSRSWRRSGRGDGADAGQPPAGLPRLRRRRRVRPAGLPAMASASPSRSIQAVLNRKQIRYDWPLIESDPNRCILCEKCVKVDHEMVRSDAIEVVNRGEETIIDTQDGKPLNCDFCGNCVGVCPTGALIDKPFKFRGRPWTYHRHPEHLRLSARWAARSTTTPATAG